MRGCLRLETYPVTYVDLEIVDVDTPGDVLNVGEQAKFRVKVTNRGPLNLTGVTLRVRGQNGATVWSGSAAAPFVEEFITQELPRIAAHGGSQLTVGSMIVLQAPGEPQALKTLVTATLEAWDGDMNHIMLAHSKPLDVPEGTYAAKVVRT
jgi:hypothetical protein